MENAKTTMRQEVESESRNLRLKAAEAKQATIKDVGDVVVDMELILGKLRDVHGKMIDDDAPV